jgi:general secretion pathway protein K
MTAGKGPRRRQDGFVLVLVLLVMAALVAMVVELARGVYVNISGLSNLRQMQCLDLEGASLIESSSSFLTQALQQSFLMNALDMQIPVDDETTVHLVTDDENSKLNISTLVYPNGQLNTDVYNSLKRLLKYLNLDPSIADSVAYWMRADAVPSLAGSGKVSRNAPLDSVEELSLIMDEPSYDTLKNYVTIYGDGLVNLNSADLPVLMSLSDDMSEDLAQRIITWRSKEQFQSVGDLSKVAGYEQLSIALAAKIGVSSSAMGLLAEAGRGGIKSAVQCVADSSGQVLYWREY